MHNARLLYATAIVVKATTTKTKQQLQKQQNA